MPKHNLLASSQFSSTFFDLTKYSNVVLPKAYYEGLMNEEKDPQLKTIRRFIFELRASSEKSTPKKLKTVAKNLGLLLEFASCCFPVLGKQTFVFIRNIAICKFSNDHGAFFNVYCKLMQPHLRLVSFDQYFMFLEASLEPITWLPPKPMATPIGFFDVVNDRIQIGHQKRLQAKEEKLRKRISTLKHFEDISVEAISNSKYSEDTNLEAIDDSKNSELTILGETSSPIDYEDTSVEAIKNSSKIFPIKEECEIASFQSSINHPEEKFLSNSVLLKQEMTVENHVDSVKKETFEEFSNSTDSVASVEIKHSGHEKNKTAHLISEETNKVALNTGILMQEEKKRCVDLDDAAVNSSESDDRQKLETLNHISEFMEIKTSTGHLNDIVDSCNHFKLELKEIHSRVKQSTAINITSFHVFLITIAGIVVGVGQGRLKKSRAKAYQSAVLSLKNRRKRIYHIDPNIMILESTNRDVEKTFPKPYSLPLSSFSVFTIFTDPRKLFQKKLIESIEKSIIQSIDTVISKTERSYTNTNQLIKMINLDEKRNEAPLNTFDKQNYNSMNNIKIIETYIKSLTKYHPPVEKLTKACSYLKIQLTELTGEVKNSFVYFVSVDGILVGSSRGGLKRSRNRAYKNAVANIMKPYRRIYGIDPIFCALEASAVCFKKPSPKPHPKTLTNASVFNVMQCPYDSTNFQNLKTKEENIPSLNNSIVSYLKKDNPENRVRSRHTRNSANTPSHELQNSNYHPIYNKRVKLLDEFIIVEPVEGISNQNSALVLRRSAELNEVSLEFINTEEDTSLYCVKIQEHLLGKGSEVSIAALRTLKMLSENCWTLKIKNTGTLNKITRDEILNASSIRIGDENIGNKMLKKMGWTGGGLGARESGLVEPILPEFRQNRKGFGSEMKSNEFAMKINDILVQFCSSHSPDDINFHIQLDKLERAVLYENCRMKNLICTLIEKKDHECINVSKNLSLQEIVESVLNLGGETQKYKICMAEKLKNEKYNEQLSKFSVFLKNQKFSEPSALEPDFLKTSRRYKNASRSSKLGDYNEALFRYNFYKCGLKKNSQSFRYTDDPRKKQYDQTARKTRYKCWKKGNEQNSDLLNVTFLSRGMDSEVIPLSKMSIDQTLVTRGFDDPVSEDFSYSNTVVLPPSLLPPKRRFNQQNSPLLEFSKKLSKMDGETSSLDDQRVVVLDSSSSKVEHSMSMQTIQFCTSQAEEEIMINQCLSPKKYRRIITAFRKLSSVRNDAEMHTGAIFDTYSAENTTDDRDQDENADFINERKFVRAKRSFLHRRMPTSDGMSSGLFNCY